MQISRSIVIERPVREVFDFVCDPRNDPRWCPKVDSVDLVNGEGPGPGSRYSVVHRPVPLRPARTMDYECVGWTPPARIEWREDDGTDTLEVTYLVEEADGGSRLTQTSDGTLGAPKLVQPLFRAGFGRDIDRQLKRLKRLLESERG
jgi:uncharacterized membrane protein